MKINKTPFVLTLIAALALAVVATGCDNKQESAGDKLNNAASDTKDAVKDAAKKTGEAVKEGAQATKDAVTNAVNSITNTNK